MAIKKSELYSSLWASCDELRGGMDASQYKDYVLVMLFVKYISDKYAGKPYAPITVPKGASFQDMIKLKGKTTIGDDINKKIIAPIADANKLSDMPDFNDVNKLGSGKEMVDRLTNLIAIFEDKRLDFSKNRADGDDLLGDAYEYLMRNFATESGKSKGQFYTPSEVSRVIAKIIGINNNNVTSSTTVYDITCGSGSLLLKVADEVEIKISIFGQEKDSATAGLARMNMILHDCPTAEIKQGNTLANPLFLDGNGGLKRFDYVVANPPFSDKRWGNGVDTANDPFGRFKNFGVPPAKNGDYAYLLQIIHSLKSKGKGACILPHGVLFRGNVEAQIRKNIVRKGYIKGIIGLPPNLFYGTGIPACIVVIDKENAQNRKGIFMIDASRGYLKDGNKNRLRSMDIHKIVDVFNKQLELDKYSRMVPFAEIEGHDYNLNIPRYIDSQEEEDIQDIEAHLLGDIPDADIDALGEYWDVYPGLKNALFDNGTRKNYSQVKVDKDEVKSVIFNHPEFIEYAGKMDGIFKKWRKDTVQYLKDLQAGFNPKQVIFDISEDLLQKYDGKKLVDKYDVYQHLMNYWADTMQDDCYIIAADRWKAETYRIVQKNSKGREVDKGWTCDLVPKELVINRFFPEEKKKIEALQTDLENTETALTEMEEEHSGEDGAFAELDKVNKGNVQKRLKELKEEEQSQQPLPVAAESAVTYGDDNKTEAEILNEYIELYDKQSDLKKQIKEMEVNLDKQVLKRYATLTKDEIKTLVVDDKWMTEVERLIKSEMDLISQRLAQRIRDLAERYDTPLPEVNEIVKTLESKVGEHLKIMGFVCP